MAKIRPIHGVMSGSIAGNTWGHNRGGQYVRQRRSPVNQNTARQSRTRSWLQRFSSDWRALSVANRAAWNEWAAIHPVLDALGESIQLSGHQAYVALNTRLREAGDSSIAAPPITGHPAGLDSLAIAAASGTGNITLTFTPTPIGAGIRLWVWAAAPVSPGRYPNRARARLQGITAANAATGVTVASRFTLIAGLKLVCWVHTQDATGQVSAPLRAEATIS
jgi:hypothetical protein